MELYQSPVLYDNELHTYELNGKILSGITSVIKEKVCPNEYADVPKRILDRAAEIGSAVHSSIELYAKYGIKTESPEFDGFLQEAENSEVLSQIIDSEHIVSDEEKYASPIDIISAVPGEPNSVYIIDVKRTRKLNIPYVTWQTSIYKMLFERQNPEISVKGIYVLWLRDDNHRLQELNPHSEDECMRLLYTAETFFEDSVNHNAEIGELISGECDEELELLEKKIKNYHGMYERAKKQYDECLVKLRTILQTGGYKKYSGHQLSATIKAESERESFDSKKFKKDHPDIYNQYITKTTVKSGITVRFLDSDKSL